jgi:hypothetical protein
MMLSTSLVLRGMTRDPCWFIGLRLAKTVSFCSGENKCSDLFYDAELDEYSDEFGANGEVSCTDAYEYLTSLRETDEYVLFAPEHVLSDLSQTIHPGLERLLYSDEAPNEAIVSSMHWIDNALLQVSSSIVDEISQTDEMRELLRLARLFADHLRQTPLRHDLYSASNAVYVHFLLDLFSLIDSSIVGNMDLEPFIQLAHITNNAHRHRVKRERSARAIEIPVLQCAKAIEEIGNDSVSFSVLDLLGAVGTVLPQSPDGSLADALLRLRMEAVICPRIVPVVELLRRNLRVALSVLELCLNSGPFSVLMDASMRLSVIPFPRTYSEADFSLVKSKAIVQGSDNSVRFRTANDFPTRAEFESSMRNLGRAIGATFRDGQSLFLNNRFEPHLFVPLMKQLSEERMSDHLGVPIEFLLERVYEPIFFIRIGICDVLGPAGILIFRHVEWLHALNGPEM